ncbi:hypothetical protein R3P38DRAFT_2518592 [Favolaschia claudopus]|uniref:Uncharacterized protein n=1 Tax=Favolaschia claudopus TaxID=2862362 RepID=A0AAW0CA69_9AGAR
MALLAVLQLLDQHPTLRHIKTAKLLDFLRFSALLKRDIDLTQPARQNPQIAPDFLPESVSLFLSSALDMLLDDISALWAAFKDEVWEMDSPEDRALLEETTFKTHGWHLGISTFH